MAHSSARCLALVSMGVVLAGMSAGACEATRSNGESCIKDRECESELCRSGVCVPEPHNPSTSSFTSSAGAGGSTSTGGAGAAGGVVGGGGGADGGQGGLGGVGGVGGNLGGGGS